MKDIEEIGFEEFIKRAEFFRKFFWWRDIEKYYKPDSVYVMDGEQLTIQLEEDQHLVYIVDKSSASAMNDGGPMDLNDQKLVDVDKSLATGKTVLQKGILMAITANLEKNGDRFSRSKLKLYALRKNLNIFEESDNSTIFKPTIHTI